MSVIYLQGAQGPPGGIGAMGGVGEKVRTKNLQTFDSKLHASQLSALERHFFHRLWHSLLQNELNTWQVPPSTVEGTGHTV